MERSPNARLPFPRQCAVLVLALLSSTSGCAPLISTGIYVLQGGNVVPAECNEFEGKRVVVVCRPPSTSEYSHAGAARVLTRNVTTLLRENVKKVEMVEAREVDKWLDESDWDDIQELGRAVKADRLLVIDMEHFDLYKGKTLYQGAATINLTVYDVKDRDKVLWERDLGEMLFPANSAIPVQDKPAQQFEREYIAILARQIAVYFYKHDPNANFALDALANR